MALYYFSESYTKGRDAGNKARNDVERLFQQNHLQGLFPYLVKENSSNLTKALNTYKELRKVMKSDKIFIQYPLPIGYNWLLPYILQKRKCILLIHDLVALRIQKDDSKEIRYFNKSEFVIVHNDIMANYLFKRGVNKSKVYSLKLFDYLTAFPVVKSHENDEDLVCFAGNLTKSKFIYSLPENVLKQGVSIFGMNYDERQINKGLIYRGAFDSEEIHLKLCGRYGLIWDGESCDTCSGNYGSYMRYNNPHKLSMYIAAGMPVIVWDESAIAHFVIENKIGFVVSSLAEIEIKANTISKIQYREMTENVLHIQKLMVKGYYLSRIIAKIDSRK